jgi:hypothetical protein
LESGTKILIEKAPWPNFEFWGFGWIMVIRAMECRGAKLGFMDFSPSISD